MSCEQRYDDILLLAAGALDAGERDDLEQHLATGCPRCAGAYAEAAAVVSHLAYAAPAVEPSPQLRARILAQVAQETTTVSPPAWNVAQLAPRRRWVVPTVAAGLAATVTAAALLWPLLGERQHLLGTIARQSDQLAQQDAQIEQLEAAAAGARRVQSLLASNRLDVIPLGGTALQPKAGGRVLWDRNANRWHVVVTAMQPLPTGRTYELWFVTGDQRKIAAGTFDVDADGNAALTIDVPGGLATIALAAITDEPAGGSEQPTGGIQAVGSIS